MTDSTSTPVVLLAFANDRDDHLELLQHEAKEVKRELRELHAKKFIELASEESVDLDELYQALARGDFRDRISILHYGGHADGTALRLQDGPAHSAGLAGLLGAQQALRLVFLNGCATKEQVDHLFNAGVKGCIATSVPIRDDKATDFSIAFYQALVGGRTIRHAFEQAEAYLKAKYPGSQSSGVVYRNLAAVPAAPAAEAEKLPWALYVAEGHAEWVLDYKLPTFQRVVLPASLVKSEASSSDTNSSLMLVLDVMAKYNPDIYDQMTEMRGEKRVLRDSRTRPEIIIRNFPWPIGSQVRLLQYHDGLNADRMEHLISAYLRTAQLLYAIALSDLWEKRRNGRLPDTTRLETPLPVSESGYLEFDFLAATCRIIDVFRQNRVPTYIKEFEDLADSWSDEGSRLRRAHRILEDWRKRHVTDVQTATQRDYRQTELAVSIVLRTAAFISRYRMLTVRGIGVQAPRFHPVSYDLDMGPLNAPDDSSLSLYQDSRHRCKDGFANSGSIILVRDEDLVDSALNLSPFILDKHTYVLGSGGQITNRDRLAHLFMLAYEDGERLYYLSVNHSVYDALTTAGDRIHTDMSHADFTTGRNLGPVEDLGDMGLEAALGLDPPDPSPGDEPKVFESMKVLYDDFKADLFT